jgi:hypothetical protein
MFLRKNAWSLGSYDRLRGRKAQSSVVRWGASGFFDCGARDETARLRSE